MRVGLGSCTEELPDAPILLCGLSPNGLADAPGGGAPDVEEDAADRETAPSGPGEAVGDPLLAALVDALLGAAGLGDFRSLAAGAPATPDLLARAVRRVERENYQVVNVDVSLRGGRERAAESERLASHLAEALHVSPGAVSVKWSVGMEPEDSTVGAFVAVLLDQIGDIDALHASIRGG